MKKISLLTALILCNVSIFGGGTYSKNSELNANHQISETEFKTCKENLPVKLKQFVEDFSNWPKEDKDKIKINGLSFMISGLSKEKEAAYDGNLGYWIDCRTITQSHRENLIFCLQYTKQQ
ncbi:MAG TPA: hypothetical protein VHO47_04130 [Candidatus Babeliales bacterium]|nr:hypothetical protein [Candidatus Babeliales bacterium]